MKAGTFEPVLRAVEGEEMSEILSREEFEDAIKGDEDPWPPQRYEDTIEALAEVIDVNVFPDDPDDIRYVLEEKGWLS